MKNFKVLSLFSGGGGLDIGFLKAGFDIVCSVEFEEKFCKTLELNKGQYFSSDHKTVCADISKLQPEELHISEVDFIIGGPPCQSFSAAGRRAGGVYGINDTRGSLFYDYCRFIKHFQPKAFLFENVRGLLQANKSKDWDIIKAAFEELGYTLSYRVLDAADYGVPQHRERLILVGIKNQTFLFPRPTHGPDSLNNQPYVGVGEAINDINDPNEIVPPYGGKYGELLAEIPPGMNYSFFTEKMGHPNPKFAWRSKFSDFLYKADPEVPCKTIVASQGKYGGPFHWKGRKFTIEELKRIQSFPDDYEIYGPFNTAWKQLGNSVAPKFAEIIAKSVLNQVFDSNEYNDIPYLQPEELLSFDARKGNKARKTRKNTKRDALAANQLSLFENTAPVFEEYKELEKTWSYDNPRLRVEKNISTPGLHGDYSVKFVLENGICKVDIEKQNITKQININLNITFDYAIANRLSKVNCNLVTNSPWDIFVAWDSVHYAINQLTSYDDLHPLYGHFTEPYPKFTVEMSCDKEVQTEGMIKFLQNITDFRYLEHAHSVRELETIFPSEDYLEVVKKLRYVGFDIRVHQTNRTIPEGYFKICYPFTLSQQTTTFAPWLEIGTHRTADFKLEFLKGGDNGMGFSVNRKEEIVEKLEEVFISASKIKSEEEITLDKEVKKFVEDFSGKINSAKTAFTNIVTCLVVNACDPNVDPRYHRPTKEGMEKPPAGKTYFSGRSISEEVIYPWLASKGFRLAKSGWQTRTFERLKPYNLDYPENIGRVKEPFLKLLNLVADEEVSAEDVLLYFFYLEIKEKERKGVAVRSLAKTRVSDDTLIQDIIGAFEKHFSGPKSSRLPVLAIYATYQTVFKDIKKYEDNLLLPLSEHSASDIRTNAIGDIEILDADGDVIEAVEIKHLIEIDNIIALKAQEKIGQSKVDRYYILTTHSNCSIISSEVQKIINEVHDEHHCELIVNGVVPTMKYYLRLASNPQEVIEYYSKLLEDDSHVDREHIAKWTEIIQPFTKVLV